ncbi:7-deoxyloganetin glucosyltransferase-like [Oryza brachyantha]|uniref:7-deoxyloganetin glucosyltransferase-like n=1 Tax=Oryza brachyantha TaxID=4533 RepID=UPI001ADA66A9|nr:7-deoxyloganetin glucosyltransferase-like [Oryza brachyantha]
MAMVGGPAAGGEEKPHAVCVPYPAQGDVTPTLHLAKLLHARGFHVTFVNTEFNHRRLLAARGARALDGVPGFVFATIPDGLPAAAAEEEDGADAAQPQDIPALCQSTATNCLGHLLALLARLDDPASGSPPVTCLVADGLMSFAYDAAREIGVPCAALWTPSACGFLGCRLYRRLIDRGLVPLRDKAQLTDGYLDTVVDGALGMCDGIQLRDFPSFIRTTDRADTMLNFIMREAERLSLPDAVILNTFDDLERPALDAMRAILPPVYAVGPLHLHVRHAIPAGSPLHGVGSNLWKEHDGVLEWLDGHPPRSVVYVSYGSIAVMTSQQLLEFAWGLADSGYAFVWVVRPDLVRGGGVGGTAPLPPEFNAAVEGRGILPTWCAQEKVLDHAAVGVFLTHSGWNSTLESLSAGVPMLSWPFFAEQQTNCRYKRTEWGVGMEIGGGARRDEVAGMIREAMAGEKGREMRRRAAEWKEKASRATLPGGPAWAHLDRVIHEVLLSSKDKAVRVASSESVGSQTN